MLPSIKDILLCPDADAVSPVIKQGPYDVMVVPDFGFIIGYFQEDEPTGQEELEDAWSRLELVFPGIQETSLAGILEHNKDGRTLVLELYVS